MRSSQRGEATKKKNNFHFSRRFSSRRFTDGCRRRRRVNFSAPTGFFLSNVLFALCDSVCVSEWVIFLPLFHTNTHVHPGGMVVGKKFPLFLTLGVTRGRTMSAKCWTGSIDFFCYGFCYKNYLNTLWRGILGHFLSIALSASLCLFTNLSPISLSDHNRQHLLVLTTFLLIAN